MPDFELQEAADRDAELVRRRFFDDEGRLRGWPAKRSRQLAALDLLAQRFVPGVRYTETEVDLELLGVAGDPRRAPAGADHVTLRRQLVDHGLLDRADGRYWRSGGTVPLTDDAPAAPAQQQESSGRRVPTRRERIVADAAELFSRNGYAAVGMNDIGAASGVTGPAIYRHFPSKAAVLAAVFDDVIDTVVSTAAVTGAADTGPAADALLTAIRRYSGGVARRRAVMAVFVREVHHLPEAEQASLRARQRELVSRWRSLLAQVHPGWDAERVRTAVHAAFGLLNAVGLFHSPLPDEQLAAQLADLAADALQLPR